MASRIDSVVNVADVALASRMAVEMSRAEKPGVALASVSRSISPSSTAAGPIAASRRALRRRWSGGDNVRVRLRSSLASSSSPIDGRVLEITTATPGVSATVSRSQRVTAAA